MTDIKALVDDLEALLTAEPVFVVGHPIRRAITALRDMTERLADANQSICAFAAPWAATYARDFGLPEGSLHATHFDILEAAGARMVSFTRHDPSAPNQAKEAGQ